MAYTNLMPLTETLQVVNGAHILYVYEDENAYLDNAVSFTTTGIAQGQHTVFIVDESLYARIVERLRPEVRSYAHFTSADEFYLRHGGFDFRRVLANFRSTTESFVTQQQSVRTWGEVKFTPSPNLTTVLNEYETECDMTVSELGYISVCAYNGRLMPASIHTRLMKSHPYLMTDDALVTSNLYKDPNQNTPIPSLAGRAHLESEVAVIRRKLDVAHVVSHEVRNPLTVIRAYAAMLRRDEPAPDKLDKLDKILDYCTVIDHELTHIITTEQMLLTDSLWAKRLIRPIPVLLDVIDIMAAKARTQNIRFEHDLSIPDTTLIAANNMGLRLVVSNLLSNAIKYSSENSVVRLTGRIAAGQLLIHVADQGIGIPTERLDALFEKYERADDERSGQGIGLFMVKQITEAFDGTVTAHSQLGVGSCFQVSLPCACATGVASETKIGS